MRPSRPVLLVLTLLGLCGCSPPAPEAGPAPSSEGKLITEEQIRESGLSTAWEVIRRYGTHLTLRETSSGQTTGASSRGRESIMLPEAPLLVLDGTVSDLRALDGLPARDLMSIRILTGSQGTTWYGMYAAGGVIEVRTRRSDD